MTDLAVQEDELIRSVFAFTIDASRADAAANPPVVHLAGLAEASEFGILTALFAYSRAFFAHCRGNTSDQMCIGL